MQNELCRLTRRPSRDCYVTALVGLVGLLLSASASVAQQKSPPPAQGNAVPTFEALPHSPLPPGEFVTWCGQNGRYLFDTAEGIQAYQGNARVSAPLSISSSSRIQCGQDGRELVFASESEKQVTKVDIESGKRVLLATMVTKTLPKISFSPDLQSVATNVPLWLLPAAGNLRVIQVGAAAPEEVGWIAWSPDGSRIMVTRESESIIDVLDANGQRLGGGSTPEDTGAQKSWFSSDQQALVLLLNNPDVWSEPGSLVKCSIAKWECKELKSRIDQVSIGGRGLMGTVGPLDKPRPVDRHSENIYSKYAAEIRGDASELLVRQVFQTATGRRGFDINIAPSGRQAVLSWTVNASATCPSLRAPTFCEQGILVDLAPVIK